MKKTHKNIFLSIIAVLFFFFAIGIVCFSIPNTISSLSDSTLAYVETHPETNKTPTEDYGETLAIADSTDSSELTYTAPLGETLITTPNYMSVYLVISVVEFTILAILLILTPIFVRIIILKQGS